MIIKKTHNPSVYLCLPLDTHFYVACIDIITFNWRWCFQNYSWMVIYSKKNKTPTNLQLNVLLCYIGLNEHAPLKVEMDYIHG